MDRFLCMRRDVSFKGCGAVSATGFSLHAQRCFYLFLQVLLISKVFSACAEMFLMFSFVCSHLGRFLCMRRDVSEYEGTVIAVFAFSLHAQRCFSYHASLKMSPKVFSACAEMFLSMGISFTSTSRFLCMRRDVSLLSGLEEERLKFSLHAQRCFLSVSTAEMSKSVFSACAEMFPTKYPTLYVFPGFLCMRRDVSKSAGSFASLASFSLHAQRCFRVDYGGTDRNHVFSACAEMFLKQRHACSALEGFLCMRRDVSGRCLYLSRYDAFSLHAQRCFSKPPR